MAEFAYISARGDRLALNDNQNFELVNIDGQTAAAASISTVVTGGEDGDRVNNIQAQPRTIILDIRIFDKEEETKRELLTFFKIKKKGTLVWHQDGKTLKIDGVVESVDMPRWNNAIMMQIALHCSNPFWQDDEVIAQITDAVDSHYFTDIPNEMLYFLEDGIALGEYDTSRTKNFYNAGDVAIGVEIEIIAYSTVVNPIIYNQETQFFGCGYGTGAKKVVMQSGDVIKINTKKNMKSVTLNGVSILDKLKPRSTWLQLEAGDNTFSVNSDDNAVDNMTFAVKYQQLYI